ncbi:MAG: hypothetical protein GC204_15625, partial [Chloroflexi bacterium]|nr:hypothetical protein [Chloroflexota bacterium]
MQLQENRADEAEPAPTRPFGGALVVIGLLALGLSALINFSIYLRPKFVLYAKNELALLAGLVIAGIAWVTMRIPAKWAFLWRTAVSVLMSGALGIFIGTFAGLQLLVLPKMPGAGSGGKPLFSTMDYVAMIFAPLRNSTMQVYLLFLALGT